MTTIKEEIEQVIIDAIEEDSPAFIITEKDLTGEIVELMLKKATDNGDNVVAYACCRYLNRTPEFEVYRDGVYEMRHEYVIVIDDEVELFSEKYEELLNEECDADLESFEVRTSRHGEAEGNYERRRDGTLQILGYSIPAPDHVGEMLNELWERTLLKVEVDLG